MSICKTGRSSARMLCLILLCLLSLFIVTGCLFKSRNSEIEDPDPQPDLSIVEEFDNPSDFVVDPESPDPEWVNWNIVNHTAGVGYYNVQDGVLQYSHTASSFLEWLAVDPLIGDYSIEAKVKFKTKPEWSGFGFILRRIDQWVWNTEAGSWDADAYWVLFQPQAQKVLIEKRVNWSVVSGASASKSFSFELDKWYFVRAEIRDTRIKIFVDDEEILSWADETGNPIMNGVTAISLSAGTYEVDMVKWMPLE